MCVNCGQVIAYCNGGGPGQKCVYCFHPTGRCRCPHCPQEYYEISHVHTAVQTSAVSRAEAGTGAYSAPSYSAPSYSAPCGCMSKPAMAAQGFTGAHVTTAMPPAASYNAMGLPWMSGEQALNWLANWFAYWGDRGQPVSTRPYIGTVGAASLNIPTVPDEDIKVRKEPPEAVKQLLSMIFGGRAPGVRVDAKDIPEIVLAELNKFAADASGVNDCTVDAIYGCGSCCNAPNARANLVATSCGWQCWNCYGLCDEVSAGEPQTATLDGQLVRISGEAVSLLGAALGREGCQGNACNDVSIDPNPRGGYFLRNHGRRRVRIRIRWMAGWQCVDWTDIDLNPGETKSWGNGGYCHPWHANYI